jgi:DNA topoisomerase-1
VRDATKFYRSLAFAERLPAIRKAVDRDMALPGLPRRKVLATIVHLLENTLVRVGNSEYARVNGSYGLTTLRTRHVDLNGSSVKFSFPGKGKKLHEVSLKDRRVARVIERCLDLPGYELFQYLDENGRRSTIDAGDVNEYLREISGAEFTAKDFRTWAGTVLATGHLLAVGAAGSEREVKANIVQAVNSVSEELRNTPTVCRKSYIHPLILEAYTSGSLLDAAQAGNGALRDDLDVESLVIEILRREAPAAEAA